MLGRCLIDSQIQYFNKKILTGWSIGNRLWQQALLLSKRPSREGLFVTESRMLWWQACCMCIHSSSSSVCIGVRTKVAIIGWTFWQPQLSFSFLIFVHVWNTLPDAVFPPSARLLVKCRVCREQDWFRTSIVFLHSNYSVLSSYGCTAKIEWFILNTDMYSFVSK